MKFQISKDAFLDALNQVQNVVSTRTTLPILSNVMIEASDGLLKLTTNDLDVGVSGQVEADVTKPGVTTLPARRLAGIIAALPAEAVEISVDSSNYADIKSGPSFFKIIGLGVEEFPALPDFDGAKEFTLPQRMLKDAIKKTSYAISNDETRYVLNGIFTSFRDSKLTLVATDGRRLAMVENELEFPANQETDVIIPTKAVTELGRLLGDEGDVTISLSDSQVRFTVGTSILVSKLIEGSYPNYRQVIPGETKHRIEIERSSFLSTVRRVSLLSSDKSNSVKLSFGANSITIAANSPDIGNAEEALDVKYDGPEFAIAFNPEFLQAPLKALDEDTIFLDLIDELNPGVLRIDGAFLYVLMPMRVTS